MARKILLADDSVTAQNMGRKILADAGYEVFTVNNGSAALKRITETRPDLIVLDVYMPGYSGLEVCQRLKDSSETARIPVLLTVGKLEPFKPEEARRVRADAHIVKPFEASELLSALARLEDRMVPQADGSRFSSTVTGLDRFDGDGDPARMAAAADEADTGWKRRLTFPSKKKKKTEEPEEPEETAGNFREFRKKGKGGKAPASAAKPTAQEPGLVPDIPRDITPEELDALSALAAKLDGPIPAAENTASLAEEVAPTAGAFAGATAARSKEAGPTPTVEAKAVVKEFEIAAPAVETAEPANAKKEAGVVVASADAAREVKTPVAEVKAASIEEKTPAGEAKAAEMTAEKEAPQSVEATTFAPVNAAGLAQEVAPVDRQDEPMFAAAETPDASAAIASARAEEKVEAPPVEVRAEEPIPSAATVTAKVESAAAEKLEETKIEAGAKTTEEIKARETAKSEELKQEQKEETKPVEAVVAMEAAVPAATTAKENQAPEVQPSDEELAEALRLLTPATGHVDAAIASQGTAMAAGKGSAAETGRTNLGGSRWVAEAVAVSPEEAALSLEEEMFRTFASAPAGGLESPAITNRVSEIAAAVENRMAEAGLASGENGQHAQEAVAESVVVPTAETPSEKEPAARETGDGAMAIGREEEQKAASATEAVEAAEEEVPATFADVAGRAVAEDPSLESGGQEEMAKDKGKSGKSNWNQTYTASGANADAVEVAKEPEAKAMAAAATADSGAASSEAGEIASIVDSVLADLRPKIVEEIAKKLGKK